MTDTRNYYHDPSKVFLSDNMKLASRASEQNIYLSYVCLVNDVRPGGHLSPNFRSNEKSPLPANLIDGGFSEDNPIQVERSKAIHELAESYKRAELDENAGEQKAESSGYPTTTSGEESDLSENDENIFVPCDNPNVLKLTKMKWLTEDPDDAHDSSSPSLSPYTSSSNCSQASENEQQNNFEDKYLSTILRLDKEHNMFGLSNIAIVGAKPSKVKRKDDEKAVFHQTAIVQICCTPAFCCRHKSNTDLPASLKCGKCGTSSCASCMSCCNGSPSSFFDPPSCAAICTTCCKRKCICKWKSCCPRKCSLDCYNCYGLKIKLDRKTPIFEEPKVELTPRSSCIMTKPIAARGCTHTPCCSPPSSCFPYLTPCYWPARPSAPCATPTRCFHNPPCLPARKIRRVPVPEEYICGQPCLDEKTNKTCENDTCPGRIESVKTALETRFGAGSDVSTTPGPTEKS